MDATPATEPAKSVDIIVASLLPRIIDDTQQRASFRDHERYIKYGRDEAYAFLAGLPQPYRGNIREKLFNEEHAGLLETVDSSYKIVLGFRQGARLIPPHAWDEAVKSAEESEGDESQKVIMVDGSQAVFIPGFDLGVYVRDTGSTAAILQSAVDRFYIQVDSETGGAQIRRIRDDKQKQTGLKVLKRYLPKGTEVRTMYADAATGVGTSTIVL